MKALPTTGERFDVLFSGDPAVDFDESDWSAYIQTADAEHAKLTGDPHRYVFRPLTKRELAWVLAEEGSQSNVAVRGYAVVSVSLVEVSGPEMNVSESELRRARSRRGGVVTLPDECPILDREPLASAIVEIGNTAFYRNFRVGVRPQAGNAVSPA